MGIEAPLDDRCSTLVYYLHPVRDCEFENYLRGMTTRCN